MIAISSDVAIAIPLWKWGLTEGCVALSLNLKSALSQSHVISCPTVSLSKLINLNFQKRAQLAAYVLKWGPLKRKRGLFSGT